ncbi:MAG: AMP-binding protein [Syntrophales bacterium]|nr:AMP-binding protein [Syntrophales bacterium]
MDFKQIEKEFKGEGEIVVYKLKEWAEKKGDSTFIYYGEEDQNYSFAKFNQLANSIAHGLQSLGVKKGDRVSLFLKNSFVSTVSMFGIWKAGAVFCPINYNFKGKLLSYQIKDAQSNILISERGMVPLLNEVKEDLPDLKVILHSPIEGEHDYNADASKFALDASFDEMPFSEFLNGDVSDPGIELQYWDMANIIYTSGTTGLPKGVVHAYRWMNNYTFNLRRLITQDDVIYNDLPMYHVAGAFALVAGATWIGCPIAMWDRFSTTDFWKRIKKSGASFAVLMDVMVPWLTNAPATPDDRNNTLNKAYMAPLPEYHQKVARRFGFHFIMSGFGQTEAGNGAICIMKELEDDEGTPKELYKGHSPSEILAIGEKYEMGILDGRKEMPRGFMGRPPFFYEANILNTKDEECAPGEPGELVFRPKVSHLLFREYFEKPEATLKAFRNLWFHTGDACYKDEKGNYFFIDRMGGVIRVRGEFVSSYQVEDIINGHPKVDVSAALPIPAEVGDESDIAVFIVLKPGMECTEEEIHGWAKKQMPKFMLPKYVRFIDDLPKTPTSKIEKYKLREMVKGNSGK